MWEKRLQRRTAAALTLNIFKMSTGTAVIYYCLWFGYLWDTDFHYTKGQFMFPPWVHSVFVQLRISDCVDCARCCGVFCSITLYSVWGLYSICSCVFLRSHTAFFFLTFSFCSVFVFLSHRFLTSWSTLHFLVCMCEMCSYVHTSSSGVYSNVSDTVCSGLWSGCVYSLISGATLLIYPHDILRRTWLRAPHFMACPAIRHFTLNHKCEHHSGARAGLERTKVFSQDWSGEPTPVLYGHLIVILKHIVLYINSLRTCLNNQLAACTLINVYVSYLTSAHLTHTYK